VTTRTSLSVADRLEIEALYARFCHAIDSNDADGWASSFAENGTFADGALLLDGREELRRFASGRSERLAAQGWRRKQHWITNLLIEGDECGARGRCYVLVLGDPADETGMRIDKIGTYIDEIGKVDGEWLFLTRKSGD
jgi:hypothetical protein